MEKIHNNSLVFSSKFLSPFLYYIVIWACVLIAYFYRWSNLLPPLSGGVVCFFSGSFILSFFFYKSFPINDFELEIDVSLFRKKIKTCAIVLLFLYGLEIIAAGGTFPLLSIVTGNTNYGNNFGLPFIHVFIYVVGSLFSSICFISFLISKNKKFLFFCLFFQFPGILTFTRSYIMFNLFVCVLIFISTIKVRRENFFKYFLVFSLLLLVTLFLFGVLGEIRNLPGQKSYFDGFYISSISYPTDSFKNSKISPLFLWAYCYLTTPLSNLLCSMENFKEIYFPDINWVFFHLIPDMVKKRVFHPWETLNSESLVVSYFNVSSVYSSLGARLGIWGLIIANIEAFCLIFVTINLAKRKSIFSFLSLIYLSTIVVFNMFSNMYEHMGLAPQFWISLLLSFDIKKVFMFNQKNKKYQIKKRK